MQVRNKQNFAAGMFFTVVGIFFALVARSYSMGTPEDVGPGYFPFWVATIMTLLGATLSFISLAPHAEQTEISRLDWKSTLWVVGSVLLFGFLLEYLGAVFSTMILVLLSSMGSHEATRRGAIASALVMAVIVYLVFVMGLHLQFPAWPTLFKG